jgi:hypothetical protein
MKKSNTHGGYRENSGRKAAIEGGTVQVTWRVSPATKQWLNDKAKEQRTTIGVILERLISLAKSE